MSGIILALDFDSIYSTEEYLDQLDLSKVELLKIGYELYYSDPSSVEKLCRKYKKRIFLDLKLHDIPNTVEKALKALDKNWLEFISMHCLSGEEALMRAVKCLEGYTAEIAGVTLLTSLSEDDLDIFATCPYENLIYDLAHRSYFNGVTTFVCPVSQAKMLKEHFPIKTICPGIRYDLLSTEDQKQTASPKEASQYADYIVVGRQLSLAENKNEMLAKIYNDFKGL